jgi:hypothetical protein
VESTHRDLIPAAVKFGDDDDEQSVNVEYAQNQAEPHWSAVALLSFIRSQQRVLTTMEQVASKDSQPTNRLRPDFTRKQGNSKKYG